MVRSSRAKKRAKARKQGHGLLASSGNKFLQRQKSKDFDRKPSGFTSVALNKIANGKVIAQKQSRKRQRATYSEQAMEMNFDPATFKASASLVPSKPHGEFSYSLLTSLAADLSPSKRQRNRKNVGKPPSIQRVNGFAALAGSDSEESLNADGFENDDDYVHAEMSRMKKARRKEFRKKVKTLKEKGTVVLEAPTFQAGQTLLPRKEDKIDLFQPATFEFKPKKPEKSEKSEQKEDKIEKSEFDLL